MIEDYVRYMYERLQRQITEPVLHLFFVSGYNNVQ